MHEFDSDAPVADIRCDCSDHSNGRHKVIVTAKADVWALGNVVYEMFTSKIPWAHTKKSGQQQDNHVRETVSLDGNERLLVLVKEKQKELVDVRSSQERRSPRVNAEASPLPELILSLVQDCWQVDDDARCDARRAREDFRLELRLREAEAAQEQKISNLEEKATSANQRAATAEELAQTRKRTISELEDELAGAKRQATEASERVAGLKSAHVGELKDANERAEGAAADVQRKTAEINEQLKAAAKKAEGQVDTLKRKFEATLATAEERAVKAEGLFAEIKTLASSF